jgi:hypothetical protein
MGKEVKIGDWVIEHQYQVATHQNRNDGRSLELIEDTVIVEHDEPCDMGGTYITHCSIPLDVLAEFLRACGYDVKDCNLARVIAAGKSEPIPADLESKCLAAVRGK